MSEKRTPDSKFKPDFSPLNYAKINQEIRDAGPLDALPSRFEHQIYELEVLVKLCQLCDASEDDDERSHVIFLHDILREKITEAYKLIEQLQKLLLEVAAL